MLKHVLRLNAASCAVFGAIFAFAAQSTAQFVGDPPVLLVQILGVGLMTNAALLIWASTRALPDRNLVLMFALGDGLWVIATAVLLAADLWITTGMGIGFAIVIALFVGACGVLQWLFAPAQLHG